MPLKAKENMSSLGQVRNWSKNTWLQPGPLALTIGVISADGFNPWRLVPTHLCVTYISNGKGCENNNTNKYNFFFLDMEPNSPFSYWVPKIIT